MDRGSHDDTPDPPKLVSAPNAPKPMLMAEGGDIPLLLVFGGMFGGAVAFGFVGIFLGPSLVAVGYSRLDDVTASPA